MKAVYFNAHGDISVLRYGDVPEPETKPGWVKLRVKACSLNYLDIFSRRGMPGIKTPLPGITGGDCAGEVVEVGGGVEGVRVGERYVLKPGYVDFKRGILEIMGENRQGALAEYVTCRPSQLVPIPDNVAAEDAACLPVAYGTAHKMLFARGGLKLGETVLVLGASGGVGNAVVLLAKGAGAYVIAAVGSDAKCERLKHMGADETVNYSVEPFDKYIRRTRGSLVNGGGVDVVVNHTGGDTWVPGLRCVKHGGRVLCCGATAGYSPQTDLRYLWTADMDIRGSSDGDAQSLATLVSMVSKNELKPVIDSIVPLSEGIEACRRLENRDFFGKIVVKPS